MPISVAFVRGAFLNPWETQNYLFDESKIDLTAFSSQFSLQKTPLIRTRRLFSPSDLQRVGMLDKPVSFLSNRVLGDSQILLGLEAYLPKYDIVHVADPYYYYSFQAARLRFQNKIKCLISTFWETIPFNNEGTHQKKKIKRFALRYIDYFICHSKKAKNCLIEEGVSKNKISLIRLGVDLERFKPNKKKYDKVVVLSVGRFVSEKGMGDIDRAFSRIKSGRLKLEIVKGQINYEDMPKTYQNADIFVLASKKTKTWEEQYGMVLVEAMASGLPIAAYDSGAISEVIGDAGILVSEGDVAGLSKTLERLISDPRLRMKLGTIGRKRAELEFDSRKISGKIASFYKAFVNL